MLALPRPPLFSFHLSKTLLGITQSNDCSYLFAKSRLDLAKWNMNCTQFTNTHVILPAGRCPSLSPYLNLPSLRFRRCRGDTIEPLKIIRKIYDEETVPKLTPSSDCSVEHTRCRRNKLLKRVWGMTIGVASYGAVSQCGTCPSRGASISNYV